MAAQQMTDVLAEIKSKTVKSQEKYGFSVKQGREAHDFGPFDTREAATKTAKALTATGLTVSDVRVIWTVSTARSLAAVRTAKMAPAEEKTEAATA